MRLFLPESRTREERKTTTMSQRKAVLNQTWSQAAPPPAMDHTVRSDRRGASNALAKAVSLHLDGKPDEALSELYAALDRGEKEAEIYSALGHIHFQLEQF